MVGQLPSLRPYQLTVARAILQAVQAHQGGLITVMMSRQAGKNELSAQLELFLLLRHADTGGQIVKCAPTFRPQLRNSLVRLQDRLRDVGLHRVARREQGDVIVLGRARALFLSAAPLANVVGATASLLLEVDEAQDVLPEKFDKDFRPMVATTNATTVLYGTAWDDRTLLERAKQENLALERRDGRRRHFEYDWQAVAAYNPAYRAFIEVERQRLGESHPLFQTQYCLRPLTGSGRLFSPSQRAQIEGQHPRLLRGDPHKLYVAGVDLAGEAEEAEDAVLRAHQPRRDSTVVTILEVEPTAAVGGPTLRVVQHYYRTGVRHPMLYRQLLDLLGEVWRCRRILVDATGVGQPVASFLAEALGARVVPFSFTAASKSELAFGLLAAVNAGRLKMYAADGSVEHAQFWRELELARYRLRPNQLMDFFVDPADGHDDFLMSLALAVQAGDSIKERTARGRLAG